MHEINKICFLKSLRSPLEDNAERNFKDFGRFSFEHFIRSPARKRSTLVRRRIAGRFGRYRLVHFMISGYAGRPNEDLTLDRITSTIDDLGI